MFDCLPRSLFSRDFDVRGLSSGPAAVEFELFTEQGRILCAGEEYLIRKHGVFSGRWTLERGGAVVADARKVSAMSGRFEISGPSPLLTLRPVSLMGRSYEITSGYQVVGGIRPEHAFTRRTSVYCEGSVPESVQLFCFWLTAMMWRRRSRSAAAS